MKTTTLLASLAAAITMTVGSSFAQTYNFTPTVDGHVSSGYGSDFTSSTMGAFAHPWWSGAHALVKFDLSGLGGRLATNATLTLNVASVGDPGDCTIWQLGPTAWTTNATEMTYDGTNGWPNYAGLPPWGYDGQSGSAVLPATAVTMNVTGAGSYSWDVTSIVNSWLGGANNSGFMIGTWQLVYGAPGWNAPDVYISTMEAAEGVRPLLQINAVSAVTTNGNTVTTTSALDGSISSRGSMSFSGNTLDISGSAWYEWYRSLIKFDLSYVNLGSGDVGSAKLRLYVTNASNPNNVTMDVTQIVVPWGPIDDYAQIGWYGTDWPADGNNNKNIDYAGGYGNRGNLGSMVITTTGWVEFDITAAAMHWLDTPAENYGMLLAAGPTIWGAPDTGSWTLAFASTEAASNKPELVFELRPPPTLTIARSGSNLEVTWSDGRLETTTNLANPDWTTVLEAVSPLPVSPTGPARFYRAVRDSGAGVNRPLQIQRSSNVTVDGNLSEWSSQEFVPLDQDYDGDPFDISEAHYAARWVSNKVYVAVKVLDTDHWFTANYVGWNAQDCVEMYLHTTGTGPVNYLATQADAQQYKIGIVTNTTDTVWTAMGDGNPVPSWANLAAAGKVDGQWIYYEAALTPFAQFSLTNSSAVVQSVLSGGQVIGMDVVVVGTDPIGYTGMKSENMMTGKSTDYTKFGKHLLVP